MEESMQSCSKFDELKNSLETATHRAHEGDTDAALCAARANEDIRYHVANCAACQESNSFLMFQPKPLAA
jgi:hypothetical protein